MRFIGLSIKEVKMAKKKKTRDNLIGSWAFLLGVVLALIFSIAVPITQTVMWILVVIGLVVGFLNVADKEVGPFLMSGAVLIIVSALGQGVLYTSPMLVRILDALLLIFVPATIIVAIKNVFAIARR